MTRPWFGWLALAGLLVASVAQATPTVRGVGAKAEGTGDLSTMDVASGTVTGDLLLLFCSTADEAITTPSGWSLVQYSSKSTGGLARATVFSRVAVDADVDGTCEACSIADPGNHALCRIISLTTGTFDASAPIDANTTNTQGATSSISITGTSATVTDSLVFAVAAGSDDGGSDGSEFSGWTNASVTSITERIDNSTIMGSDGSLGVATGVRAAPGAWGTTTATGPSAGWANLSFNVKPAPPTPTPTNTGTATAIGTNTQTPSQTQTPSSTGTRTNTATVTNTATRTATSTVTATSTATATKTNTATVTSTPTATTPPKKCVLRVTDGGITLKGGCTMPEDDGMFLFEKPTPGSGWFEGRGSQRGFDEFRDANDIRIGTSPAPHILKNDPTFTSSLDDARTIIQGVNPVFVQEYTSADVSSWGGCTTDQGCTIDSQYNFTDELPQRQSTPIAAWPVTHVRCGPVPLNGLTYYCPLSGGGVQSSTQETKASHGCDPIRGAVTLYDGATETALPASCALSVGFSINGVSGSYGICPVSASSSRSADDCNITGYGWNRNDMRGLVLSTTGAGCTGALSVEVEWACSGE